MKYIITYKIEYCRTDVPSTRSEVIDISPIQWLEQKKEEFKELSDHPVYPIIAIYSIFKEDGGNDK